VANSVAKLRRTWWEKKLQEEQLKKTNLILLYFKTKAIGITLCKTKTTNRLNKNKNKIRKVNKESLIYKII
jgi:hypothetical protein